jgi:hypothetical protein
MLISNDLFQVTESSPAEFAKAGTLNMHYLLTLMLHRERDGEIYLNSPGFVPAMNWESNAGEIETVVQIFFRIF